MFEEERAELKDYENLENNWDGYNGLPIQKKSISAALKVLDLFQKHLKDSKREHKGDVMPDLSGDGTVGLLLRCYYYKTKEEFEVYFLFDEEIEGVKTSAFSSTPKKITEEIPEKIITFDELSTYFDWILNKQK